MARAVVNASFTAPIYSMFIIHSRHDRPLFVTLKGLSMCGRGRLGGGGNPEDCSDHTSNKEGLMSNDLSRAVRAQRL